MDLPRYPRFKKGERPDIPRGTRLARVGLTEREALSAGPFEASAAERAVYGWLQRHNIPFAFQVPVMGGRLIPGGAVLDFVIYLSYPPLVIRVQSYWHTDPAQVELDALQKAVLEREGFRVEDIWEWETMDYIQMSRRLFELIFGYVPQEAPMQRAFKPCPYSFDEVCPD